MQLEQPRQLDEKPPPSTESSVQVYIDADQLNFDGRGELVNWGNGYSWIGFDHSKARLVAGMDGEGEDQEMQFTLWSLPEYQVLDQRTYPGDPCSASVYIVDDRLSFERSSGSEYIIPYYRKMECGSSGTGLFGVLQDSIWRLPFVSPDGRTIAGFACSVGNEVMGVCLQGDVFLASTLPSLRTTRIQHGERRMQGMAYEREKNLWAISSVGDSDIELLRVDGGTLK